MGGFDQGASVGITAWGAANTAQYSHAGDPNGVVVATAEGDLCVDTTTPALYQALGAGTAWQLVGP